MLPNVLLILEQASLVFSSVMHLVSCLCNHMLRSDLSATRDWLFVQLLYG